MLIKIEGAFGWVLGIKAKTHGNSHVGKLWNLNWLTATLAKSVTVFVSNNA